MNPQSIGQATFLYALVWLVVRHLAGHMQHHPKAMAYRSPKTCRGPWQFAWGDGCEDSREFVSGSPQTLVNWLIRYHRKNR